MYSWPLSLILLIGVIMNTVTYNTEKIYLYYHAEIIPVIYKRILCLATLINIALANDNDAYLSTA